MSSQYAENTTGHANIAGSEVGTLAPSARKYVERFHAIARGEPTGRVYFIQGKPGSPVKIGYTGHDPNKRIAELQTGNPYLLRVIYSFPGNPSDEKKIHRALASDRLSGEWFECSKRLLTLYATLQRHGLAAAIETCQGLQSPDVPPGWDDLAVSESGAYWVLSLPQTNTLSKARVSQTGPGYMTVVVKGRSSRYYLLGDLKRWLVEQGIPHRVAQHHWHSHVFECPGDKKDPSHG